MEGHPEQYGRGLSPFTENSYVSTSQAPSDHFHHRYSNNPILRPSHAVRFSPEERWSQTPGRSSDRQSQLPGSRKWTCPACLSGVGNRFFHAPCRSCPGAGKALRVGVRLAESGTGPERDEEPSPSSGGWTHHCPLSAALSGHSCAGWRIDREYE